MSRHHDYPLMERPAIPNWSENFALVVSDIENRLSIFYSIGTWYSDPSIWREIVGVALPDGNIYHAKNYGCKTTETTVSASLSRFEIVEPEQRLRLTFQGPAWVHSSKDMMQRGAYGGYTVPLDIDIYFDATAPLWDMTEKGSQGVEDKTKMAGGMHTEQLGRCNGTLNVRGKPFGIQNAAANRDHSRGSRDGTNYRNHCWMQGQFSDGRGFLLYAMKVHGIEGIAMQHATVIQDGKLYPATIKQLQFVDSAEDVQKPSTIVLNSEFGDMKIEVKEVFTHIPIAFVIPHDMQLGIIKDVHHAHLFEEAATMEVDGIPGVGWYERGYNNKPLKAD